MSFQFLQNSCFVSVPSHENNHNVTDIISPHNPYLGTKLISAKISQLSLLSYGQHVVCRVSFVVSKLAVLAVCYSTLHLCRRVSCAEVIFSQA